LWNDEGGFSKIIVKENFRKYAGLKITTRQQRIKNNCHMPITSKAVARIYLLGFESLEARTWQLFLCQH